MVEMPQNLARAVADDPRDVPPLVGDEREILTSYLDYHRYTLDLKCAGVPASRLAEPVVEPSTLSLHGLVRHLAGVERWWFRIQFAGEELPLLYYSDDDPDQDFEFTGGDFAHDLAVWHAECERSREIVAAASLDATGIHKASGRPIALRRIMVSTIAEYARHNGHADLLRERIDGTTGY